MSDEIEGRETKKGAYHPLTILRRRVIRIFDEMGFAVAYGPEIETEWYNFDALNIPENHPARDLWDTFWLQGNQKISNIQSQISRKDKRRERLLLRTHTSSVQIRYMEENDPPIQIIAPGKVFRYEATDATHETQFYQLEGLMIGEEVTMQDLKGTLSDFFEKLFKQDVDVRLRPSYFPFVEPGVEVDMTCFKCGGGGAHDGTCSVCGGVGWVEIMGAGMVHPTVLENVGIDPRAWQGFAFGMGLDRLAMLLFSIPDVRLFYNGDLRLITQFEHES